MSGIRFHLKLLDDVIISAKSATQGDHECLDHLPGSVFLGSAAASFYRDWKANEGEKAWQVFHSGKVRFLPAYPVTDEGRATRPAPLSWHYPKGSQPEEGLSNRAVKEWRDELQPKQVREGWFDPEFQWIEIRHRQRLKTAVDPNNFDRSKDASLFNFSSLPAGTCWGGGIEWDEDVAPDIIEALKERFATGRRLRLGRSRKTEFGRAEITEAGESAGDGFTLSPGQDRSVALVHLLSDLALVDPCGQPSLDPALLARKLFASDEAAFLPEKSFLRTRIYSPYNLFRNAHDPERQVVSKGSVLAFDISNVAGAMTCGMGAVGACQAEGLGSLVINPDYLLEETVKIKQPAATKENRGGEAAMPSDPWAQRMKQRYEQKQILLLTGELAREWKEDWRLARSISNSQWARIRAAASGVSTREKLIDEKLSHEKQGIFKHGLLAEKWNKDHKGRSAATRVLDRLNDVETLKTRLEEAGAEASPENMDRLALASCREAAILTGREKRND